MPEELLTVAEIADELKLNQQTIRNMIDRGDLAALRIGERRVRVRRSALDDFIEQRETSKTTKTSAQRLNELEDTVEELRGRVEELESKG